MTDAMVEEIKERNPIMPEAPMGETRGIVAPHLLKQKFFKSEHGGSENNSDYEDEIEAYTQSLKEQKSRPLRPQTSKPSQSKTVK